MLNSALWVETVSPYFLARIAQVNSWSAQASLLSPWLSPVSNLSSWILPPYSQDKSFLWSEDNLLWACKYLSCPEFLISVWSMLVGYKVGNHRFPCPFSVGMWRAQWVARDWRFLFNLAFGFDIQNTPQCPNTSEFVTAHLMTAAKKNLLGRRLKMPSPAGDLFFEVSVQQDEGWSESTVLYWLP